MDIREKAMKGLKLDEIFIMDCHAHGGYWNTQHIPGNMPEDMIRSMDWIGVDMAMISSQAAIASSNGWGNDITVGMTLKYPDRFYGYVVINPHYPESHKEEIERCFVFPGMKGLKIHPNTHGVPPDHYNYQLCYETANERRCPMLIHTWGRDSVVKVGQMAERYPNARLIMGHYGGPEKGAMSEAVNVVNKHENVYADITISYMYEGNLEWLVKEAGAKKVLYGTDLPFIDARPNFGRVALAEISDEDKTDIFGRNMKRILGMEREARI